MPLSSDDINQIRSDAASVLTDPTIPSDAPARSLADAVIRLVGEIHLDATPPRHPRWPNGAPVLCGQRVVNGRHGEGLVTSVSDDGSIGCKFLNTWLSLSVEELRLVGEGDADD